MRSLSQRKYTYKAEEIKRERDKENTKREMSWKKYEKCCAKQTKLFMRSALCFRLVCVLVLFCPSFAFVMQLFFSFCALHCECD